MQTHKPNFNLLDHTADLGIKVRGTDLKDLFAGAARSMMQLMVKGKNVENTTSRRLSVSGEDLADLMIRWLGEILYLFDGEKEVVDEVQIDFISNSHLDATLRVAPFDSELYEILHEIKAVTYHQIEVAERAHHWEATIIFDL